jgi:hypothetical protein
LVHKPAPFVPLTFVVFGIAVVLGMNSRLRPAAPVESSLPAVNNPEAVSEVLKPAAKPSKPSDGGIQNPMLTAKTAKFKPMDNPTSAQQQWFRQ